MLKDHNEHVHFNLLEKMCCCVNFSGENVIENVIHDLNEALMVKSTAKRMKNSEEKPPEISRVNKWEVESNEDFPEKLDNNSGDDNEGVILKDERPKLQRDGERAADGEPRDVERAADDLHRGGETTVDEPECDEKRTVDELQCDEVRTVDKKPNEPVKKKRGRKPKLGTATKVSDRIKVKEKKLGK